MVLELPRARSFLPWLLGLLVSALTCLLNFSFLLVIYAHKQLGVRKLPWACQNLLWLNEQWHLFATQVCFI